MDQNNLDKLFQEKFEDFSSVPDEKVWKRIESSLNQKQKKRVVPIWWTLGSVAAILVFALLLFNPFAVDENLKQNPVSNTEENTTGPKIEESNSLQKNPLLEQKNPKELVTQENDDSNAKEESTTTDNNNSIIKNESIVSGDDGQLASSNQSSKGKTNQSLVEKKLLDQPMVVGEQTMASANNDSRVDPSGQNETENKIVDESGIEEEAIAISESPTEKKSIYEAIEEQLDDDTQIAENSTNRWTVGPSIAPVYFNAIGEGSPIHSNFSENGKSGKINLSYGISVAYDVGKKLKIRSGVHRVNMGYGTDDILFSSSVEGSTNAMIDNINYNQASRSLVVESSKSGATQNFSEDAATNAELLANENPALNGSMVQQLGYFEVPMELNYALVDKKFGVNLIGGVSSLFLVDNSVSLESQDGLVTEMGEANNVNSVNFSTNVGLGLNYQFSEKIQLNVEPIFKYQLNTFSESAGNFNPYSVGVYSGLSFRF